MSSMMWHLLNHSLLLVFLTGTATVLGKATDNALECGEDKSCVKLAQLLSAVSVIKNQLDELATTVNGKLDKQEKDLEDVKTDLNRSLASTAAINTQLGRHSTDLLSLDGRLKANDACPDVNEKLDKLATNVHDITNKQAKDLEELKTDLKRTLASTSTISSQLERHSTDLLNHDGRLKAHDVSQRNEHQLVQSIYGAQLGPRDCSDIRERGYNTSGIYRVYPGSDDKRIETDVYCDFQSVGEGWLVFQRRKDGSVNFERLWKDYANGFGNLNGEFWLGNEKLSLLTMNRKYKLRVELEDFTGEKRYADYSIFSVKPATDKYRLTVGGYAGNSADSLSYHNGMMFTTKDVDNDRWNGNCAVTFRGAWWHDACHHSNLNGLYLGGSHTSFADGIEWHHWRGYHYSYKTTEMKIAAI